MSNVYINWTLVTNADFQELRWLNCYLVCPKAVSTVTYFPISQHLRPTHEQVSFGRCQPSRQSLKIIRPRKRFIIRTISLSTEVATLNFQSYWSSLCGLGLFNSCREIHVSAARNPVIRRCSIENAHHLDDALSKQTFVQMTHVLHTTNRSNTTHMYFKFRCSLKIHLIILIHKSEFSRCQVELELS